jgi:hypothetical protein
MESERLAIIGQLAAGVAHELNNPLQGIVTYSHLLLETMPNEEWSRGNLEKIVTQANRCRDIVRGLLDFSRQRKPNKTLYDVNIVLRESVSLLENQALFHNIQIKKALDPTLPMTVIDPSQIEARLDAVEVLYESGTVRAEVREELRQVSDLERLTNRVLIGRAGPRDLLALDASEGLYMNIVAMTPAGEVAGFTTVPGKQYLFQRAEMDAPQLADRLMVE